MSLKGSIARMWANKRVETVQRWLRDPIGQQERTLQRLLHNARKTVFGREYRFSELKTEREFQHGVPVRKYEEFVPWIERAFSGEPNVLWPGIPSYFAETSGTTAGAKHIPLTHNMMRMQVRGARDALFFYIHETGKTEFLDGNMIFLSGSPELHTNAAGIPVGRLSGISQHFVPKYLQRNRLPSFATNCIDDWEQKLEAVIRETSPANMTLISGIPPWVQMYFERLEHITGQKAAELWPNLQLYIHGGVDYRPYKDIFLKSLGANVDLLETYPASEGFIAVQNTIDDDGLLLMLDYDIFYEFIPLEEYGTPNARRLTIGEVELNQNYALVMSTNAGLWSYEIGDTVRFTSLYPHKIRVSGRVKHFISAFGEHVIQEEVNNAMLVACSKTNTSIIEFSVAPYISTEAGKSYHEWFVEFELVPSNMEQFQLILDSQMRMQNVYYDNLRSGGMLQLPPVRVLAKDAIRNYMKSVGKLGGQNKFPRLSNNRDIVDKLEVIR